MASEIAKWNVEAVLLWLIQNGLGAFKQRFQDEEIDGETLLNLTERMVERLFPTMKYQVLFRKRLDALIQHLTEELKTVENPVQVKEEPCSLSQISSTSTEPKPQGSPHPGPYVLPYFPPLLAMELENNNKGFLEPGKSRLRSQLINILADDIANYEWYPGARKYDEVMRALLLRYPRLNGLAGEGRVILKNSLLNKMKKKRLYLTSISEIAKAKLKYAKRSLVKKETIYADDDSASTTTWCTIAAATDSVGVYEGSHYYETVIEILNQEYSKQCPNTLTMRELLMRISHYLKELISARTAKDVLKMAPFLTEPQFLFCLMAEFFSIDLEAEVSARLSLYSDKLQEVIDRKFKLTPTYKQLFSKINHGMLDDNDIKQKLVAFFIPCLFDEDEEFYLCIDKVPTHSFPSIYLQTVGENHETGPNIFICADGVQMAQCASEEGGHILATLLSIYYVYNIPYPKHLRHSLHFIQLALCGRKLTKDEKIPVPVSNMLEFVLQQVIGEDDLLSKDDQGDLSAS